MSRVELPGGAWAELRDPDTITERSRKPLVAAVGKAAKYESMDDALTPMVDIQDILILVMVASWSFGATVSADALLDLPHKTVTALRAACSPFMKGLLPDFGPTPEPDSPTPPSNA